LLNIPTIEKMDSKKMFEIYEKWPKIAKKSFEDQQDFINYDNINHIIFAGMGGSGAIGDTFSSILSKTNIHVNVVKGYILPQTANANTLVVAISASGNTIETLTVLESAHKLGCKIIVFSSGGKMQKYCKKNNIEHRIVPMYNSPRSSFTSYLYTILNVLHGTLKIKKNDIIESLNELKSTHKKISVSNLTDTNPSLNLAKWIINAPIIYYPFGLQSAAIRFKNSLQENTKNHASTEDVIEFCHNGIVAWESNSEHQPVLIQGVDDNIKTKERWVAIEEFFSDNKIEYWKITSVSGSILTKIINLIYVLDYASIYKAALIGIDPSPVKSINYIKEKINTQK
jgi:glucose/mannose-6-phosphate isomerase